MKIIKTKSNKKILVDEEDYDFLNQFCWRIVNGYAVRNSSRKQGKRFLIRMHRLLINPPNNMYVDHINGNKLDNRKENLRVCTNSQNQANQKIRTNKKLTKYKGITWDKRAKSWRVTIHKDNKRYHLGYFKSEIEAAKRYDLEAIKLFGEFAKINGVKNGD